MFFLLGAMVCSTLVIHCFRWAQARQYSTDRLLTVNYVLASLTGWIQVGSSAPGPDPGWTFYALAVFTGLLFIGNFFLLNYAIEKLGPFLAAGASRMSAVIPVALSIVVYAELPSAWGWAGLVIALAALPLSVPSGAGHVRSWAAALAVFIGFGGNDFLLKVQSASFAAATKPLFFALVYTVALAVAVVRLGMLATKPKDKVPDSAPRGFGDWGTGALLGVANYGSAIFFSGALGEVPGSQAYALNAVGVIVLVAVSSRLVWKERLTPRLLAFGALASIAVVLLFSQ